MGIWMEIRCDVFGDECLSHDNIGPKGHSDVSKAPALEMRGMLMRDAKELGWKLTREGIRCPRCQGISS